MFGAIALNMKYVILICVVLLFTYNPSAARKNDNGVINIYLTNYNGTVQFFDVTTILYPNEQLIINVSDVFSFDIDFFIIQVHSFKNNVMLSTNKNFLKSTFINGTNIGLVQTVSNFINYQFFVEHEYMEMNSTLIYIVIIPYKQAPIPGGCNMEFTTEIAPYQRLQYSEAVITVDAQSASMTDQICEMQVVQHEVYRMYLPETDFSSKTYFDSIRKMLTVKNITNYGTQVSKPLTGYLRQLFSSYKGTGSVYVIVANFNNSKSAYVPIVSYGCDIQNSAESCDTPTSIVSKVLCSALVFLGLFTCFFGHKFFKTEMFLVGSLVGGYISYIFFTVFENLEERDTLLLSLGIGCLLGLAWVSFWHYCGIPILSTLLTLLVFGFLVASVIFYAGISDITIVHNDITYWGFFTSIVLLCMTILTGFIDKANILACGIVGAYAFIIPLDHYYGTNLKYIFINTVRRATVGHFRMAVIDAPYQWKDLVLTVLWLALAFSGVVYQWRQQLGRPPFPPTTTRLQPPSERTPLLRPTSTMDPSDRIILIHSVPSDA